MNISFSNNGLLAFLLKPIQSPFKKIIFVLSLTWLPLFISPLFLDSQSDIVTIFNDFELHVRFLILLPVILYMERKVDLPFENLLKEFEHITDFKDKERYKKEIDKITKVATSIIPEVLFYALFYCLLFLYWDDIVMMSKKSYLFTSSHEQLNFSGWYYLLISLPFFQLLIFRWIFRWLIWAFMLYRISKLSIQVDPVHADIMGGLEFINLLPFFFSFLLFVLGGIIASHIGFEIVFEKQPLKPYSFQIIFFSIFFPLLNYMPLLFFMRKMFRAKRRGILLFGRLLREHNVDYFDKWIYKRGAEELLGSMDNSSLSDINGSYGMTQSLKIVPVNTNFFTISVVVGALPYIPLLFTQYSITELFKQLVVHFVS